MKWMNSLEKLCQTMKDKRVNNMNKISRMKELAAVLNEASKAYYQNDSEIMSNYEYDKLYDELVELEKDTGTVLAGSPTMSVGYESIDSLPKERHESPMLSLDKTKERENLVSWLGKQDGILSWKLDGLTVVLTYNDGKLVKAVTRGNGEIGEVITNNARTFDNLPLVIPYKDALTIRGEAVISYEDFEKINNEIADIDAKYKNPRNLCSGSVRQLNNEITASRHVKFIAFSLVSSGNDSLENYRSEQFEFLSKQGFEVVEHYIVSNNNILDRIQYFADSIENNPIPSDGLVLSYNDIQYGRSLGRTSKFPRDSIAFKWADELAETTLTGIEWSPSRTGLINPVALFEPVELEGTTVKRASVHNISIVKKLKLGVGDRITVYKANMIIPQIEQNLTGSGNIEIPETCPACGGNTVIQKDKDVETLMCTNPSCGAKRIKSFTQFVSRDALNVDGLSEATLEKFLGKGYIKSFADLFRLNIYANEISSMDGFGEKSCANLIESIDAAKKTTLPRLLYGLGIPNIGVSNAKMICKYFNWDISEIMKASTEALADIDGVGDVIAESVHDYFSNDDNINLISELMSYLLIENETDNVSDDLQGMIFVITGSLEHYDNREQLKEEIENRGGKVTGSVTGKTTCLINNDILSASSKNRKAKELGVRIISENDFIAEYL